MFSQCIIYNRNIINLFFFFLSHIKSSCLYVYICTCLSKIRYHYRLTNKSYYYNLVHCGLFFSLQLGYSTNTNNNNQYVIISWCLDIVVGFSHEFLCIHTARLLHVTCDSSSFFKIFSFFFPLTLHLHITHVIFNKSELWPVSRVVRRIVHVFSLSLFLSASCNNPDNRPRCERFCVLQFSRKAATTRRIHSFAPYPLIIVTVSFNSFTP